MSRKSDPVRRLPRPAQVHAHIGHLLRELRLARRLLNLLKAVDQERDICSASELRAEVPDAA
jgi:hypothetical protein